MNLKREVDVTTDSLYLTGKRGAGLTPKTLNKETTLPAEFCGITVNVNGAHVNTLDPSFIYDGHVWAPFSSVVGAIGE